MTQHRENSRGDTMKVLKVSAAALLLVVVCMLSLSCASKAATSAAVGNQIFTVKRGDIKIDITASGNLKTSREVNLTFGSSGTVKEVLVGIGDYVEEGEVLARIDTLALERSLTQAQVNVKSAQLSLERALEPKTSSSGTEILSAPDPLDIEIKELQLKNAKQSLKEAEENLANATLTAPFTGLVAEVNVIVGDQVGENTVVIRLIDPTQFEVEVLVNEMEIYQVNVGAPATLTVAAIPTIAFPARVTHISPVATVQSNVVNYKVKVQISSLETSIGEQSQATPPVSAGEIPERLKQAIEAGQITQEQAEEMMSQRQQRPQQGQILATMPKDFHLKEGLTVTVSIWLDERNNVLLVPNKAITSQGGTSYVQVLSSSGVTEARAIQTGISDWQYTEVTSELNEGEQVAVPQGSTATTTPAAQQQQSPGGVVPGMQRMLR
ncbi:MAG: efflux RND transporter periplasmic adaptor subunit [Chloroflexi bacterium]|nr:efflux RND transporter periplasmic adaptor subunit [Chloroflexota bacterium]